MEPHGLPEAEAEAEELQPEARYRAEESTWAT